MDKTIQINNYAYQVHIVSSGQPTWVFLHGFLGSRAEFSAIQPQGTCIYVDLLGFGEQAQAVASNQLTVDYQVGDLKALIEHLTQSPVHLVGYSMGARLALSLAIAHPSLVQQLVLESGTAGLRTESERVARREKDARLAEHILKEGLANFVTMWESLPLFASQETIPATQKAAVRQQRLKQRPMNMAASLRAFGTGSMPNYWPLLAQVDVPTMLITGERDQKFTTIGEALHAAMPKSAHIVVPGVGHNVHLEAPEAYTHLLDGLNLK